jgi:hypothetical protein
MLMRFISLEKPPYVFKISIFGAPVDNVELNAIFYIRL